MTRNTAQGDIQEDKPAQFSQHKDSLIVRTLKACLKRETDHNNSVKIIPWEIFIPD